MGGLPDRQLILGCQLHRAGHFRQARRPQHRDVERRVTTDQLGLQHRLAGHHRNRGGVHHHMEIGGDQIVAQEHARA